MWTLQDIVRNSENRQVYRISKNNLGVTVGIDKAIELFKSKRLIGAKPVYLGANIVSFEMLEQTDKSITFRGYDKYRGVLQPGEVATIYIQKHQIVNKEPALKLKILSDSDVILEEVTDKTQIGTLEIPWFVTQIRIPKENESNTQFLQKFKEQDMVLGGCHFREIIIHNSENRPLAINYLCQMMRSMRLRLKIDNPKSIVGISHLFYGQVELREIEASGIQFSNGQTDSMFEDCFNLRQIRFSADDYIVPISTSRMFKGIERIQDFDDILSHINLTNVVNSSKMFMDCKKLKTFDFQTVRMAKLRIASLMFKGCSELVSVNQGAAYLPSLTDAQKMFLGCRSLLEFDFHKIHIPKVQCLNYTFSECDNLKYINLQSLQFNSLKECNYTFSCCSKLRDIEFTDTSFPVLESMRGTFQQCHLLSIVDFKNQKLLQLRDIQNIIGRCRNIVYFDMISAYAPNITCINLQFQNCPRLKAVRLQDSTINITDAQFAFSNDPKFSCSLGETVGFNIIELEKYVRIVGKYKTDIDQHNSNK